MKLSIERAKPKNVLKDSRNSISKPLNQTYFISSFRPQSAAATSLGFISTAARKDSSESTKSNLDPQKKASGSLYQNTTKSRNN